MSVVVNYKGEEILSVNTDTAKTLKTSGKYCEADIEVVNTQDGGITPTGNINITDTNVTDVTNYATAQISSDTLLAENIKKNINILGVVGSFEGGGGGLPNVRKFTVTTDPTLGTYGGISFPISTSGIKIYVVVNSAYRNKLNSTYRYLRGQIFEVENGAYVGKGGYRYDGVLNTPMDITVEDGVATCTGIAVIHMEEAYTLDVYEVTIT